jgi:serine protease Do
VTRIISPLVRKAGATRLVLILPLLAALLWLPVEADARGAPNSFADLAERLLPAVVNISTTQKIEGRSGQEMPQFDFPPGSPFRDFFEEFNRRRRDAPRKGTSLGSGFIIDKSGFVVTNNHVIDGADEISVVLQGGKKYDAKLIGKDAKTDLALLQIKPEGDLPALEWGNSTKARVGDWVMAIGNPLGLGGTVTAGIISARGRDIRSGPYDDYIQTDAPINRGNSGGPLFNLDGEIIGINTAILSPSGASIGIGFAIPSNLAKGVIEQIKEFGTTRRGWLGVQIQTVDDAIAESLGLDEPRGALVAGVIKDSPAEAADFKTGDVILKFDGVKVPESRKLPRIVADTSVGKSVAVVVWREGKRVKLSVKLGELEKVDQASFTTSRGGSKSKERTESLDELGLTVAPLTKEMAKRFEVNRDVEGVMITKVARDSSARDKGLRPGNIIVEVNQQKVSSPAEVAAQIEEAKKADRRSVLLLVDQDGDLRFVALKLKKS